MSELKDYQFELLGAPDLPDVAWGFGRAVGVDPDGFDPGARSWEVQDARGPRSDHTVFGIDYLDGGPTWAWSAHVDQGETPEDALAAVAAIERSWAMHPARLTNGAVAHLRYHLGGRTRRVYGRPRDFAKKFDNRILSGTGDLTFGFKVADHFTYDDVEQQRTIRSISDDPGGGLISPLRFYTSASYVGPQQSESFNTEGDVPAPFRVAFSGPGANPWVSQDGWRIQLDYTLADEEVVTVSTYPWDMTAVSSYGNQVPLSRSTRLSRSRLALGKPLAYGAGDTSGEARCTVTWRPTWTSL